MITEQGESVEFFLEPNAFSNTHALALHNFDLPEHSWVIGNEVHTDYIIEDALREAGIELLPLSKKNSLLPVPPYMTYLQASIRKIVENTLEAALNACYQNLFMLQLPKGLNVKSLYLCLLVPSTSFGSNLDYLLVE